MIENTSGNLIEADAEALVNTVNTVGVMGKGIALQFRRAYPLNFKAYEAACRRGEVRPGEMFTTPTGIARPRLIINFPTKRHWRSKSKIEDIALGLKDLVRVVREEKVESIAIPPLGCGLGGLDWGEVQPLIVAAFEELPHVRVLLFAPEGTPKSEAMPVATERSAMTPWAAAVIALLERYHELGYTAGKIQLQKLIYLLSEAGEPLKVNFQKHNFGPYDPSIDKALSRFEGHFVQGFGDGTDYAELIVKPGAYEEARALLAETERQAKIERVAELIEGFETPYGLELLATAHWVCIKENPQAANDLRLAIDLFHAWNPRKRDRFPAEHIEVAWRRLNDNGWFAASVQG